MNSATCSSDELIRVLAAMPHGADSIQVGRLLHIEAEEILDFSSNINPFGFTPEIQKAVIASLPHCTAYPQPAGKDLLASLALRRSCDPSKLVLGAGASDLIYRLAALWRTHPEFPLRSQMLVTAPSFSEYEKAWQAFGGTVKHHLLSDGVQLDEKRISASSMLNDHRHSGTSAWSCGKFQVTSELINDIDENTLVLCLCQPNNPTGQVICKEVMTAIRKVCRERRIFLMVDECFLDFLPPKEAKALTLTDHLQSNEIVVKSFTKLFAIPGLRLAWAEFGSEDLAERFKQLTPEWQISTPAMAAGQVALTIPALTIEQWRTTIETEKNALRQALRKAGAEFVTGEANYLFFYLPDPALQVKLLQQHPAILIRNCANYRGLGAGYYRIAVKSPEENRLLIQALHSYARSYPLGQPCHIGQPKRKAGERPQLDEAVRQKRNRLAVASCFSVSRQIPTSKAIMLLGTSSNVGKSTLAIGLCRLLARQGFRVMPFKSQNMAQYFEVAGKRYSIAQWQMAEAARTPYLPEMNPILLCPQSDSGSKVYRLGEFWEEMPAMRYYQKKKELWPLVERSYRTLQEKADFIVVEGAGSPAEINLQKDDLVNLGLADKLDIPCLLIGDIDLGGVFASLYGSLAMTGQIGKRLIKGLVINKFRGDPTILEPGLKQFEGIAGLPIMGLIPKMNDLTLLAEDSLSETGKTFSREERESAYNLLADNLEKNIDLNKLLGIVDQGVSAEEL